MKRGRYWDYMCVEEQSLSRTHAYFSGTLWKFLRKVYSLFMYTYIIDFIFWLIHVIMILFFSFFLGPFFGLCGVLLFTTHTCIDARLYTYSQDGLLMLTTVWFKPNVKCLLCLEHLHRRFWMSRHQGQSFIL